jgi:hypothetical protein
MKGQGDSMERPSMDISNSGTGLPSPAGNVSSTWDVEDRFWADNFSTRPWAVGRADPYDRFRPAFRYGHESAQHHMGRKWEEAEPDLRTGWDRYEHRGDDTSTWDDIKDAVRDAWNRVTGQRHATDDAEHIGDAFSAARHRHDRPAT